MVNSNLQYVKTELRYDADFLHIAWVQQKKQIHTELKVAY